MSVRELRCHHCNCDAAFESVSPSAGGNAYSVTWRCPLCRDSMVDVCAIGPAVPTASTCLNCAGTYGDASADAVCSACALPRAEARTFLGLDAPHDDAIKCAEQSFQKGLYRRGIAILNDAILSGRAPEDVWILKSIILRSLGFEQSELLVLRAAVASGLSLQIQYGCALQRAARHREAADVYARFVADNPRHAWTGIACCNHANALKDLGELSAAETLYKKSLEIDPAKPAHYLTYAFFLRQQGRWSDALCILETGLKNAPDNEHAGRFHEDRAFLFAETGQGLEAITAAEAALALDPAGPRALFMHGRALAVAGRSAEAREEFQKVLAADPDNFEAREAMSALNSVAQDKKWYHFWK